MENGLQMNGRWKKNGIDIELYKRGYGNFRFDRMITSGSCWLMVVNVKRVIGRAHSKICMMGNTGRHLINPATKCLGIQTTGKLNHVNIVQEENQTSQHTKSL